MTAQEKAKTLFDGLTREEFIELLKEAGFTVEDGVGRVIFTEEYSSVPLNE